MKKNNTLQDEPLSERIPLSRRKMLGSIVSLVAGSASAGSVSLKDDTMDNLWDSDSSIALTKQYKRGKYVTAPERAFDLNELAPGEIYWVTDTGHIGIKDEGKGVVHPPLGSIAHPVSALHTEQLSRGILFAHTYEDQGADGIIAALNDASKGKEVWVVAGEGSGTNGEYIVEKKAPTIKAIDITTPGVELKGIGRPTLKLQGNAFTDCTNANDDAIIAIGSNDIVVKGLEINGNKANQPRRTSGETTSCIIPYNGASNYEVTDCICHNATNGGIKHDSNNKPGSGALIKHNEVHACLGDGIFIGGTRLRGVGNYVHDILNQDGIEPLGNYQTWEYNIVENCAGSGFDVYGPNGVTVRGNICLVGTNGPQNMVSFDNKAVGGEFVGNIFIGSGVTGVAGAADRMVAAPNQRGCEAVGNVSVGADVQVQLPHNADFRFSENILMDGVGSGVQVTDAGAVDGGGLSIKDNTIVDASGVGIATQRGSQDVTIRGNRIIRSANHGMRIRGNNHTIVNNDIIEAGGIGLQSFQRDHGHTVRNNIFRRGSTHAISVKNKDETVFENNRTKENSGRSLYLTEDDGSSHTGIVIKNHHSDGDDYGIDIDEGAGSWDHIIMENNRVVNSTNFKYELDVTGVLFRNGTEFLGETPSDINYIKDDAGRRVIDESTNPPTEYYIDANGNAVPL